MTSASSLGTHATAGPAGSATVRAEKSPWWLLVDPILVLTTLAIVALGTLLVYSATRRRGDDFSVLNMEFLHRQSLFAVLGLAVGVGFALLTPSVITRFWPLVYAAMLAALVLVALVGVEVSGTRGWFELGSFRLQPSEPAKLVVIAGLAVFLSPGAGQDDIGLRQLAASLAMTAAPIVLVLLQPDLGTVLVYLAIALTIIVASGTKARWIVFLVLLAATATFGALRSDVLADYQQARLTVFLFSPEQVPDQAAQYSYNVEQAQIAIGNGGLRGQGLFQGMQTRSQLVPAQQTDFIFTVVGEELGLRGAGALLGMYALLLLRIWRTSLVASSVFGRLLCVGIFAMFLFQMFQAVGMTMGMMPVTGIPLPLVSYGGSSMLTSMAALGLVAGVYRRRLNMDETRAQRPTIRPFAVR